MWAVSLIAAAGGLLMSALVPDSPSLPRAARDPAAGARRDLDRPQGPRVGLRLLRPHVGAVCAVGAGAADRRHAAAGAAASRRRRSRLSASGAFGCAVGGMLVRRFGSARVAGVQLAASGLWLRRAAAARCAAVGVCAWMLLWGVTVVGDSPQFSTLTALNSPRDAVGSVLTFVNCIGFALSSRSSCSPARRSTGRWRWCCPGWRSARRWACGRCGRCCSAWNDLGAGRERRCGSAVRARRDTRRARARSHRDGDAYTSTLLRNSPRGEPRTAPVTLRNALRPLLNCPRMPELPRRWRRPFPTL